MKVRAKKAGLYDAYRVYPGDVFDLKSEKEFSAKWMEHVSEPAEKPVSESKVKGKPKAQPPPKVEEDVSDQEVI